MLDNENIVNYCHNDVQQVTIVMDDDASLDNCHDMDRMDDDNIPLILNLRNFAYNADNNDDPRARMVVAVETPKELVIHVYDLVLSPNYPKLKFSHLNLCLSTNECFVTLSHVHVYSTDFDFSVVDLEYYCE